MAPTFSFRNGSGIPRRAAVIDPGLAGGATQLEDVAFESSRADPRAALPSPNFPPRTSRPPPSKSPR